MDMTYTLQVLREHGYQTLLTPGSEAGFEPKCDYICAEKRTEVDGIKVYYHMCKDFLSLNLKFESVSILGHKNACIFPFHYDYGLSREQIESMIKQFEYQTEMNIKDNPRYSNYDVRNVDCFTRNIEEGKMLFEEALKLQNRALQKKEELLSDSYFMNSFFDGIDVECEIKGLTDKINKQINDSILDSYDNLKSAISEFDKQLERDKQTILKDYPRIEGACLVMNPYAKFNLINMLDVNECNNYESVKEHEEYHDNYELVYDINKLDNEYKKQLYIGKIVYSITQEKNYLYLGDNVWKPIIQNKKIVPKKKPNKDKLLNINKEKTWKRI